MEISRRHCLSALPFLSVASHLRSASHSIHIGCQTNAWPIQPAHPETLYASLQAIRQLQFQGFETGYRNLLPLQEHAADLRRQAGTLTFFGVHIFLTEYDPETLVAPEPLAVQVSQLGSAFGAQRLISSGAPSRTPEAAQKKAKALNRLAKTAKEHGLGFAYHNHGPEFTGPSPEIDALIAHTDPELVSFVLDAGHAFRAGADIPAFVRLHCQRLAGLHLRDFAAGKQVPLGAGDFPLQAVADALIGAHYSGWVLAEEEREDGSKPADAAAAPARQALRKYFGI